jgi:hypothetical protein
MIEAELVAFGAEVTDLLAKVTISASNYNASKEVLEKFKICYLGELFARRKWNV